MTKIPLFCKLLQEVQIVIEEQAQVIDVVAQHGKAVETDTEGETGVFLRIDINVFNTLGCTIPHRQLPTICRFRP